ncbi:MAG TPA: CRISPR-associated endonuclease Cas2 [Candidatus Altiarchaeales archaeon]|nr:CRISPR-associated endonuclease Cas2 [Candidatus Altiarchaeales archaeon]
MYVILVYDISVERVSKVCQFLRMYLNWIQNSVFEGEISRAQLKEIEIRLKDLIDPKEDSVIIYKMRTDHAFKRKVLGVEKSEHSRII